MRALVQRVARASVTVGDERIGEIGPGLLVLLGVRAGDTEAEADRLAEKVRKLRVFDDAEGRMNEPLYDRFCKKTGAKKGVFGACMGVALVNDGPVTVMLEA